MSEAIHGAGLAASFLTHRKGRILGLSRGEGFYFYFPVNVFLQDTAEDRNYTRAASALDL